MEQESWTALAEYEAAVCPSCGNLRAVCSDPGVGWYPQRDMCYASAAREGVLRQLQRKHAEDKPNKDGLLPTDGMGVWVSTEDLTPGDDFV